MARWWKYSSKKLTFFYGDIDGYYLIWTVRHTSEGKSSWKFESVSDRLSIICNNYMTFWWRQTEDKDDAVKDVFHMELENLFDYFLKCYVKITLKDFNTKFWSEEIFRLVISNTRPANTLLTLYFLNYNNSYLLKLNVHN